MAFNTRIGQPFQIAPTVIVGVIPCGYPNPLWLLSSVTIVWFYLLIQVFEIFCIQMATDQCCRRRIWQIGVENGIVM
jgi:hypothetical protein